MWFPLQLRLVLEGEFEQRVVAVEAEFLADVGAVVFDRAVVDEEFGGDLFARFVVGDQVQDAPFGGRQRRRGPAGCAPRPARGVRRLSR